MDLKLRLTRTRVGVLIVVVAAIAAGVAYAAVPDGNGVYTACKLNATGTIRLIDPAVSGVLGRCNASLETQISWNQKGQPGAAGAQGPAGADGKDGLNGKDGAPGAAGIDGKDGAPGKDGADGLPGKDGLNGKDGAPGAAGRDGIDGKDGAPGPQGPPGGSVAGISNVGAFQSLQSPALTTISTMNLPAGTYILNAAVTVQNQSTTARNASVLCTLTGASAAFVSVPPASPTGFQGWASLSFIGSVTFGSSGGTVNVQCSTDASHSTGLSALARVSYVGVG